MVIIIIIFVKDVSVQTNVAYIIHYQQSHCAKEKEREKNNTIFNSPNVFRWQDTSISPIHEDTVNTTKSRTGLHKHPRNLHIREKTLATDTPTHTLVRGRRRRRRQTTTRFPLRTFPQTLFLSRWSGLPPSSPFPLSPSSPSSSPSILLFFPSPSFPSSSSPSLPTFSPAKLERDSPYQL